MSLLNSFEREAILANGPSHGVSAFQNGTAELGCWLVNKRVVVRRRQIIAGGAAILLSFAVRAHALKSYRVAYLALLPGEDTSLAKPFLQRLEELGYHQGKNMTLDYRSSEGRPERLPQLAAELVRSNPDILIAGFGTLAPKALIAATNSIPIVFTSVGDPVGAGLITSLGQPGGTPPA
jgi:putative tryptophan/tyrosine transport system substrate-binding protein